MNELKRGQEVELIHNLTTGFLKGNICRVISVSKRGDFVLGKLTFDKGEKTCGFGFAYQAHLKVAPEVVSKDIPKVTVGDGKYAFFTPAGDWKVHVLRYGEPWLIIEAGHHAVAALMYRIKELEEENKTLDQALTDHQGQLVGSICR